MPSHPEPTGSLSSSDCVKDTAHLRRLPLTPSRSPNASLIQLLGDTGHASGAPSPYLRNGLPDADIEISCFLLPSGGA